MSDEHLLDNFYVIGVISNPVRYASRYRLYKEFEARLLSQGVKLVTVELNHGQRHHKVTNNHTPQHIQLTNTHELWLKENMINIGLQRLPSNWEYAAWIDCDVSFMRPDWALETVQQLQHYQVVQMFQTAIDLGPTGEAFDTHMGFGYAYATGKPYSKNGQYAKFWHPGFAWAARREAIDHTGGLIDWAILGAADHHMALSLIGKGEDSYPGNVHPHYKERVLTWQAHAEATIKRNVGYVPGTILHHWHGKKKDRRYQDRWQIMTKNNFDPNVDIKRDWQGLWQLTPHNHKLRDDIRAYFRARNEDSIDYD